MLPHAKFCVTCTPLMCESRIHLPTCYLNLEINYTLIEIEKIRKKHAAIREFDLDIMYSGKYLARPLPFGGLDMIFNNKNGTMLSDQADFNFHDHGFEVTETIDFDHEARLRKVACPLDKNTKIFIGDVKALTDKTGTHRYRTVIGDSIFNSVYMDGNLIGYSLCQRLWGYDAVNGRMHSDEGFYCEMILRYTDKETQTVDGIMLAGLQNENQMNFQDGVDVCIEFCAECRRINGIPGEPGSTMFSNISF